MILAAAATAAINEFIATTHTIIGSSGSDLSGDRRIGRSEDRQIWKIIRWPPIDRILKFYYCFVGVLLLLPFSFFFFLFI